MLRLSIKNNYDESNYINNNENIINSNYNSSSNSNSSSSSRSNSESNSSDSDLISSSDSDAIIEIYNDLPITKPSITKPPITKPPITKPHITKPPITKPPITKTPITKTPITKPPISKQINVPKYNKNESLAKYVNRVEKYKFSLIKLKYQLVLNFINDLLNCDTKIKTLIDFKNISHNELLSDKTHVKNIIEKYQEEINQTFNFKYKNPDIIFLITRMLSGINYKLITKKYNTDDFKYSILFTK
jgi:hypothetical protein